MKLDPYKLLNINLKEMRNQIKKEGENLSEDDIEDRLKKAVQEIAERNEKAILENNNRLIENEDISLLNESKFINRGSKKTERYSDFFNKILAGKVEKLNDEMLKKEFDGKITMENFTYQNYFEIYNKLLIMAYNRVLNECNYEEKLKNVDLSDNNKEQNNENIDTEGRKENFEYRTGREILVYPIIVNEKEKNIVIIDSNLLEHGEDPLGHAYDNMKVKYGKIHSFKHGTPISIEEYTKLIKAGTFHKIFDDKDELDNDEGR